MFIGNRPVTERRRTKRQLEDELKGNENAIKLLLERQNEIRNELQHEMNKEYRRVLS